MNCWLELGLANAAGATVLAAVAVLVGTLTRRSPALVGALWVLVLLKLISPPLINAWPAPAQAIPALEEEPARAVEVKVCPGTLPDLRPEAPEPVIAVPESAPWKATDLILAIWVVGTAGYWLLTAFRLGRLERLLATLTPACPELHELAGQLAHRLGLRQQVQIYLVPGVLPPLLLAMGWKPRIVLPDKLWQSLDEVQRETLLLHELAHLRRGDAWLSRLELLVCGLYWWLPTAWWASARARQAAEECCDAWVVHAAPEQREAYALTLIETLAFLSNANAGLPPGTQGAGPVYHIQRRLSMILSERPARRLSWSALLGVLLIGTCTLPLAPRLTGADPRYAPPGEGAPVPAPASLSLQQILSQSKSCQKCHVPVKPLSRSGGGTLPDRFPANKLVAPGLDDHATVVRLINEKEAARARFEYAQANLRSADKQLQDAVAAFDKKFGKTNPAQSDDAEAGRLERLEKQLKELQNELDRLRDKKDGAKRPPGHGR